MRGHATPRDRETLKPAWVRRQTPSVQHLSETWKAMQFRQSTAVERLRQVFTIRDGAWDTIDALTIYVSCCNFVDIRAPPKKRFVVESERLTVE